MAYLDPRKNPLGCPAANRTTAADSALRYSYCSSKEKCGNSVAARRRFTWICPRMIIAKFGLCSREKRAARNGCSTFRSLHPVFCAGPDLLQGAVFGAAANPDLAVVLEWDRERMVGLTGEGQAGVRAVELLLGAAEDDHALAGVILRAPEPIILVAADDRGQAVLAAEEVDRPGFAVVGWGDAALAAVLRRTGVGDARGFPGYIGPSYRFSAFP